MDVGLFTHMTTYTVPVAGVFFLCALIHAFCTPYFQRIADSWSRGLTVFHPHEFNPKRFAVEGIRFLGEIELVFALWLIPTLFVMATDIGWYSTCSFINSVDYSEPIFVASALLIVLSKPALVLGARLCGWMVHLFGGSLTKEWFVIMTFCPLLTVFLKDIGAVVLTSLILIHQFVMRNPSKGFVYSQFAILFVNVSAATVLFRFSNPSMLLMAKAWNLSSWQLLNTYFFPVIMTIVLNNLFFIYRFKNELNEIKKVEVPPIELKTPFWVGVLYLAILSFIAMHIDFPILVCGITLFFVGMNKAFFPDDALDINQAVMALLFVSSLVILADIQGPWLIDHIEAESTVWIVPTAAVFAGIADKTVIATFASKGDIIHEYARYAVAGGIAAGGGLAFISSAANIASLIVMRSSNKMALYWPISLARLTKEALLPTIISTLMFWILL